MSKRSEFKRVEKDKYYTWDHRAVEPLLDHLNRDVPVIEPCAGRGDLVRQLRKYGVKVATYFDIDPDHHEIPVGNALHMLPQPLPVVTNPPWSRDVLHPMIEHFLRTAPYSWLLFDADWMYTKQSSRYMEYCTDIVPVGRVRWIEGTTMSGKDNCCWYRFSRTRTRTVFHGVKVEGSERLYIG